MYNVMKKKIQVRAYISTPMHTTEPNTKSKLALTSFRCIELQMLKADPKHFEMKV